MYIHTSIERERDVYIYIYIERERMVMYILCHVYISSEAHKWFPLSHILRFARGACRMAASGVRCDITSFIGWSHNHFNNLHVIISHESNKQLHVSNTQQLFVGLNWIVETQVVEMIVKPVHKSYRCLWKNIPFVRAWAMQSSGRNCSPAPDSVLWKHIFQRVFFSGWFPSRTPVRTYIHIYIYIYIYTYIHTYIHSYHIAAFCWQLPEGDRTKQGHRRSKHKHWHALYTQEAINIISLSLSLSIYIYIYTCHNFPVNLRVRVRQNAAKCRKCCNIWQNVAKLAHLKSKAWQDAGDLQTSRENPASRHVRVDKIITPSPPTKSFPTKSPRVELSGRLSIRFNGHENSHPLELRVCLSQTIWNRNSS